MNISSIDNQHLYLRKAYILKDNSITDNSTKKVKRRSNYDRVEICEMKHSSRFMTYTESVKFNRQAHIDFYADLRNNRPDLFKVALSRVIDDLLEGNINKTWHLPDFTIKDWFDHMGDDWQSWVCSWQINRLLPFAERFGWLDDTPALKPPPLSVSSVYKSKSHKNRQNISK